MTKLNPKNERIKMAYAEDLQRLDGLSDTTIDQRLTAIKRFEEATDYVDLDTLDYVTVIRFVDTMSTRDVASKTKVATVRHVKAFFTHLAVEGTLKAKGARKAIKAIRLSEKDTRAGQAKPRARFASVNLITETLLAMPKTNDIERRNRALLAFTLVSGARDGAICSMRVGHVDLEAAQILQHPDEVKTKNSKLINSWFFPVGDVFIDEVRDYITHLKTDLGFTDMDPLFPSTAMGHDENDRFIAIGLSKSHWANAGPMRDIFRTAFEAVGARYYNPHSFRNTLMALAYDRQLSGEALKAWSQNLGHEHLDTSINSYGPVSPDRQRAAILALHEGAAPVNDDDRPLTRGDLKALLEGVRNQSDVPPKSS
ncbi:MAG: tyrosine-type recombinase/integrase [Pseudomonadota bacterium]